MSGVCRGCDESTPIQESHERACLCGVLRTGPASPEFTRACLCDVLSKLFVARMLAVSTFIFISPIEHRGVRIGNWGLGSSSLVGLKSIWKIEIFNKC